MRSRRFVLVALLGSFLMPAQALAAVPGNDDRATALPLALGVAVIGSTLEATNETDDPAFCGDPEAGPDGHTVWYSFTPGVGEAGPLMANTFGSDYDTTLYVLADKGRGFEVIACNDDTAGVQSLVLFDAQAATTYLVMVGSCCGSGGESEGGSLALIVDAAPPVLTLESAVQPTASVTRDGTVTVEGSLVCSTAPHFAEVYVEVRQSVGRLTIYGGSWTSVEPCGPDGIAWQVSTRGENGRFNAGKAQVSVSAFGCDALFCDEYEVTQPVRLRRS